jgi:hypothetical protein
LRIRSVIETHDVSLPGDHGPFLPVQPALRVVEQPLGLARLTRHDGGGQAAALPQLVVVDLGDGCAEAVLQLRLGRLDVPALALEGARLRKVELDGQDADETAAVPTA